MWTVLRAVFIIMALVVLSTTGINRAQVRANATCADMGVRYEKGGMTARERSILTDHYACRQLPGGIWVSALVWSQS